MSSEYILTAVSPASLIACPIHTQKIAHLQHCDCGCVPSRQEHQPDRLPLPCAIPQLIPPDSSQALRQPGIRIAETVLGPHLPSPIPGLDHLADANLIITLTSWLPLFGAHLLDELLDVHAAVRSYGDELGLTPRLFPWLDGALDQVEAALLLAEDVAGIPVGEYRHFAADSSTRWEVAGLSAGNTWSWLCCSIDGCRVGGWLGWWVSPVDWMSLGVRLVG